MAKIGKPTELGVVSSVWSAPPEVARVSGCLRVRSVSSRSDTTARRLCWRQRTGRHHQPGCWVSHESQVVRLVLACRPNADQPQVLGVPVGVGPDVRRLQSNSDNHRSTEAWPSYLETIGPPSSVDSGESTRFSRSAVFVHSHDLPVGHRKNDVDPVSRFRTLFPKLQKRPVPFSS